MTRFYIHFYNSNVLETIYAPNAETAMVRAMEIYNNVSHVEEV